MKLSQEDLMVLRGLVQKAGWGQFMSHVAGLMAEQADKVPRHSEEDKNLFQCSNTLSALHEFFEKCGQFDYLKFSSCFSPEDVAILERYKP